MAAQRNVQEREDLVASASRLRFFGIAKLRNPPAPPNKKGSGAHIAVVAAP
jgi:hypothetical protein